MASWYRSSEMEYVQLYVQPTAAASVVDTLGSDGEGIIEFVDLNEGSSAASRDVLQTTTIQTCDEALALVNFLTRQLRQSKLKPVKASITGFNTWKAEQEGLWRESAEKYSSVLKFWDATLKMLVSRYRKHQAEVEQQLAAISEAQYTIELWEAVARRHGLDSKALGAAALADARALAVVGSGMMMGSEDGSASADGIAGTDGVSVDLAGFAGHAAAAGIHGGGLGDAAPRFFVGLVSPDQAGDFDRILRQVTRGTIRASFEPAQRPLADREGNRVEREVFVVPIVGSELPRRVLAVLESYDTFRLEEDNAEVQAALMTGSAEAIKEQIKRALIRRSNHMDLLSKNRYILASDQQERSQDIDLYRRALLRERATAYTITKFAPSSASAMGGGMSGAGGGGGDGGVDESFLRAEGWILAERRPRVEAMVSARDGFLRVVDEAEVDARGLTPPTHFPLNDVTAVFQSIIDTYSVPKYREINPAIFTAATFPALFGIMYGDVGHAGVLTIASTIVACSRGLPSWLTALLSMCGCSRGAKADAEQEKPGEFMETMWFARYVLLLNGIFGMYMGVLYNDFFSMGLDWFGSRYTIPEPAPGRMLQEGVGNASSLPVIAHREGTVDNVYPLGIDPVWHEAGNQLTFTNSLKMKMAIVVAIVHMTFGLSLRVANDWYFSTKAPSYIKRRVAWWKIWLEDIPMIVVLLSLFGYMSFLIVFKWCIDWSLPGAGQPPNLVDTMIGMVLSPGTIKDEMYPGQATVQLVLLFCVLGCIPLILLGKPLVEAHLHKLEAARVRGGDVHTPGRHGGGVFGGDGDHGGLLGAAQGDEAAQHHSLMDMIDRDSDVESSVPQARAVSSHDAPHGGHHEFEFGQEMVHQGIETIEFVLSTISHTASYLRLWALSLAHSQLSEVFWDKALRATIEMELAPAVIIGFAIWAVATAVVLCAMDVLECYLHSLRLHWVEFNSKFYGGEGSKFQPLSFDAIVDDQAEELS